jgi:hypothetical protein
VQDAQHNCMLRLSYWVTQCSAADDTEQHGPCHFQSSWFRWACFVRGSRGNECLRMLIRCQTSPTRTLSVVSDASDSVESARDVHDYHSGAGLFCEQITAATDAACPPLQARVLLLSK